MGDKLKLVIMHFCYIHVHLLQNNFKLKFQGIFMFINNRVDFGHLIDPDDFDVTKKNPDFYNLVQNQWDWEQR